MFIHLSDCQSNEKFLNQYIYWITLTPLLFQSKLKGIVLFEMQSLTWNHLQAGLPAGQLPFLVQIVYQLFSASNAGSIDSAANIHYVTPSVQHQPI